MRGAVELGREDSRRRLEDFVGSAQLGDLALEPLISAGRGTGRSTGRDVNSSRRFSGVARHANL
jgi:hypothetical protein